MPWDIPEADYDNHHLDTCLGDCNNCYAHDIDECPFDDVPFDDFDFDENEKA